MPGQGRVHSENDRPALIPSSHPFRSAGPPLPEMVRWEETGGLRLGRVCVGAEKPFARNSRPNSASHSSVHVSHRGPHTHRVFSRSSLFRPYPPFSHPHSPSGLSRLLPSPTLEPRAPRRRQRRRRQVPPSGFAAAYLLNGTPLLDADATPHANKNENATAESPTMTQGGSARVARRPATPCALA